MKNNGRQLKLGLQLTNNKKIDKGIKLGNMYKFIREVRRS